MMIEFDRDHGPGDTTDVGSPEAFLPAPDTGALERDQGCFFFKRSDQVSTPE